VFSDYFEPYNYGLEIEEWDLTPTPPDINKNNAY